MANTPQVGWHILLDENEWERDDPSVFPPEPRASAVLLPTNRRSGWYTAGILLLLALTVSVRLWQKAQAGLAAVEESLTHSVTLESQAISQGDDLLASALLDPQTDTGWRYRMEREMAEAGQSGGYEIELLDFALAGDRAMAQVGVTDAADGVQFRESRFYRETTGGWLRSQPAAELWGSPRTLESEHFVFHFRQLDGAAVAEAAPLLDAAYAHMHGALGLPLPAGLTAEEKVQVHIAVGGETAGDPWSASGAPLWVNSPRLLRLPGRVTDSGVLVETVAFSLRRRLVNRAISPLGEHYQPTLEFLSGLRLWLAWEESTLPADTWPELIRWLYADLRCNTGPLPISYLEICELFGAWQVVSPSTPMLFYCQKTPAPSPYFFWPPTRLSHLPLTVFREDLIFEGATNPSTGEMRLGKQGQPLAFATLLEYATHTYGPTSISALLQAAKDGQSWKRATPLLFGVSEEAFEAGWWAWLAQKYGVDTSRFQARKALDLTQLIPPRPLAQGGWPHDRQALAEYQVTLR